MCGQCFSAQVCTNSLYIYIVQIRQIHICPNIHATQVNTLGPFHPSLLPIGKRICQLILTDREDDSPHLLR